MYISPAAMVATSGPNIIRGAKSPKEEIRRPESMVDSAGDVS